MKINKKYLYMAVGLIAVLLSAMPAFAKDNAKIDFNESVYDFGQISLKKGKVSHEFTFTNAAGV